MPSSLSTESNAVAHAFVALELVQMLPDSTNGTVEQVTSNYKAIHKAVREAYQGKK